MRWTIFLFAVLPGFTAVDARAQTATPVFPARDAPALAATALIAPRDSNAAESAALTQAIEHSDAYYTRLTIHRYGSFLELPLFGTQYYLGQKLLNFTASRNERSLHKATAYGLAGLFTVNTVTGVWNLVESRHEKEGRTTKWVHVGLMLASDAGFAYTGTLAKSASRGTHDDKIKHRNAALVSIGLATSGTLVMWLR